jgi:hypothetical protein
MLTEAELKARESGALIRNNPVKMFCIKNTEYKIALPPSIDIRKGCYVDLLGVQLRVVVEPCGKRPGVLATMGVPLPDAWLIDLNQDVPADWPENADN